MKEVSKKERCGEERGKLRRRKSCRQLTVGGTEGEREKEQRK